MRHVKSGGVGVHEVCEEARCGDRMEAGVGVCEVCSVWSSKMEVWVCEVCMCEEWRCVCEACEEWRYGCEEYCEWRDEGVHGCARSGGVGVRSDEWRGEGVHGCARSGSVDACVESGGVGVRRVVCEVLTQWTGS